MNLWMFFGLFGGFWLGLSMGGSIAGVALGVIGMVVGWVVGFVRWSAREQQQNTVLARSLEEQRRRGEAVDEYDD